jgi:hypothetical protein
MQFMYFKNYIQHAYTWIFILMLAFSSVLLMGRAAESVPELIGILVLPGTISGLGMRALLTHAQKPSHEASSILSPRKKNAFRRIRWALLPVSLAFLFIIGTWGYALGQIELAKERGIYQSAEEAVMARVSTGWGSATVIAIENLHVGPNDPNGSLPHVWFGGADVYLDRIPEGGWRDHYAAGSFYVRIKDGWVYMPEGAFPTYVGWIMQLYNLEDVGGLKVSGYD